MVSGYHRRNEQYAPQPANILSHAVSAPSVERPHYSTTRDNQPIVTPQPLVSQLTIDPIAASQASEEHQHTSLHPAATHQTTSNQQEIIRRSTHDTSSGQYPSPVAERSQPNAYNTRSAASSRDTQMQLPTNARAKKPLKRGRPPKK